jgi:hypothetical protein
LLIAFEAVTIYCALALQMIITRRLKIVIDQSLTVN